MSLSKNVIANFAGSTWGALMGLAFVPFYIRLLGAEAYGIVGVFASLVGMLVVLDLGLSQAMTREMARLSANAIDIVERSDTARTLEVVYWLVALAVGALVAGLSDFIAYHWLNPAQMNRDDIRQALWVIAGVIALRWPVALYTGGLNGLQHQVQVNIVNAAIATMQGVGAIAVLLYIGPTIQNFFWWQALVAVAQIIALRQLLWMSLACNSAPRPVWRISVLRRVWRFAAGISAVSLLATLLTQADKLVLSKLLSLSEFGYYTFATTVAAVLFRVVGPIFTAFYPRLTELAALGDQALLSKIYHQACQLISVGILPLAMVLGVFSSEILSIWTRSPELVTNAGPIVAIFAFGNALNGLMTMPYALQLAHGWTRMALLTNLVSVVLLIPAIYFATLHWGAIGAGLAWGFLNIGYCMISIPLMHARLLRHEKSRWYVQDVAAPAVAALAVCLAGFFIAGLTDSLILKIGVAGMTLVLSIAASAFATEQIRTSILSLRVRIS